MRYAWEVFDLNDGVHWRLTVPLINIAHFDDYNNPITSPEPVTLKIDLLCSKLVQVDGRSCVECVCFVSFCLFTC